MARPRETIGSSAVAATLLMATCAAPPLTTTPRPWERGTSVGDRELVEILRPKESISSEGLFEGTDKRTYYVAELADEPPPKFIDAYGKLVSSRALLSRPHGSPHHIPPLTEGWSHPAASVAPAGRALRRLDGRCRCTSSG